MSADRFTLDTNVLVYSIDSRDSRRHALAIDIVKTGAGLDCPLALQAIGEFHVTATRKLGLTPARARDMSLNLMKGFETFSHSASAIRTALEESASGRFSFWDAVLLASAAEAGCTAILSEDMKDGARLGSIRIVNPFARDGLSAEARELLGDQGG